jgi:hypothetical protein
MTDPSVPVEPTRDLDQAAVARLDALDGFMRLAAHLPGEHFTTWRERAGLAEPLSKQPPVVPLRREVWVRRDTGERVSVTNPLFDYIEVRSLATGKEFLVHPGHFGPGRTFERIATRAKLTREPVFDPDASHFAGWSPRDCGDHRTVGARRAWCFDCAEWCYPHAEMACRGCGGAA